MRIVSWNMNRLGRSGTNHVQAWEYLRDGLRADLALVQEASPPDAFGPRVYNPIDEKRYNWGSAVVALNPMSFFASARGFLSQAATSTLRRATSCRIATPERAQSPTFSIPVARWTSRSSVCTVSGR